MPTAGTTGASRCGRTPTYGPIIPSFMREFGGASIDRGSTTASNELFAAGVVDRISIWDNRLIGIVGLRYDDVSGTSRFSLEGEPTDSVNSISDSEWSEKYGLVGKLLDTGDGVVSAYYNNS